jgi:hypothetical protein
VAVSVRSLGSALLSAFFALTPASCSFEGVSVPSECGCGQPPICGSSCQSECGCCSAFGATCSEQGILIGHGSCYEFVPCSAPNRCVFGENGPICAESTNECEAVRLTYESYLHTPSMGIVRSGSEPLAAGVYESIQCPDRCQVSEGHCAQGLDTCWFLAYRPTPELDRLASLYQELGCPSLGQCDCPPAPIASCQPDPRGAMGDYAGPIRCTVE